MELRTCKQCNQDKPFDPAAPRDSAARGFSGYTCWTCHKAKRNDQYQDPVVREHKAQEAKARRDAENVAWLLHKEEQAQIREAKFLAKEAELRAKNQLAVAKKNAMDKIGTTKTYGIQVLKAQSALAAFDRQNMGKHHQQAFVYNRKALEYTLEVAQAKAAKFGPDAYDYTPKEAAKAAKQLVKDYSY